MKKALSLSLVGALTLSLLAGCSNKDAQKSSASGSGTALTSYTYADTIMWDGQYDVVVIGFGGAGAVSALTAAENGAKVLITEKAPEGHEGGNTRVCGQLFVYGHEDEEATYNYYKGLAGQHDIPEAMLRTYTNGIAHMRDIVEEVTGVPQSEYWDSTGSMLSSMSPEYPELPGSDKISLDAIHEGYSDGYLWQTLRGRVTDQSDSIDVWFDSPAVHLIQDPDTKTILGVQIQREGKLVNIRGTNGVVLACGGFENDPEMVADYLGLTDYSLIGGLYNTGDGVRMAQEVGADLWHMEAYEGIGAMAGTSVAVPDDHSVSMFSTMMLGYGASVVVGGDGNRYFNEGLYSRHGHHLLNDAWVNIRRPLQTFIVCDEAIFQAQKATGFFPDYALSVQQGSSIAELAELAGIDPKALTATVERFNSYAKAGYDPEFGRAAETMVPFTGDSFYIIQANANILNTQGGPRRNENAEVLDTNGDPIPHLYSAGELGGITAYQYQGGGNVAECIIFGQIAGKNAAAAKEELPAYVARPAVASSMTYTPGVESDLDDSAGPDVTLGENEYLGVSPNGMGGKVYVKVTMDGDKIAAVEVVEHHETEGISDPAIEKVPAAIAEANSAEVEGVSGATITSRAIKEAVADALSQVK